MISAEDTLYLAERTLANLDGWKNGFLYGARLTEEPHVLLEASRLIGGYIELLKKDMRYD